MKITHNPKPDRIRTTKRLCVTAALCAMAYALTALSKVIPPIFGFLSYDPKDVVIVIGGFIYGPVTACVISLVTALIEMMTISETGFIGFAMNALASVSFALTASLIYKYKRSLGGALLGLAAGTLAMTASMLLWNYIITPLYMDSTRAEVAKLLIPVFLPFNLFKAALNSALTVALYRPLVSALRQARLILQSTKEKSDLSATLLITLISLLAAELLIGALILLL